MYDYYGVNLLFYKPTEIKAIRERINKLLNQVYFPGPDNKIIFDKNMQTSKIYQLNKQLAEKLVKLFDKSPAKLILKKEDREVMRFNLKRTNLLYGIKIIQDLKGIIQKKEG
jgi:hypothetical protein